MQARHLRCAAAGPAGPLALLPLLSTCCCLTCLQAAEAEVAAVTSSLEEAQERFKEFERKDVKVRADLKHQKAKLKSVTTKLAADQKNIEVGGKACCCLLVPACLPVPVPCPGCCQVYMPSNVV